MPQIHAVEIERRRFARGWRHRYRARCATCGYASPWCDERTEAARLAHEHDTRARDLGWVRERERAWNRR